MIHLFIGERGETITTIIRRMQTILIPRLQFILWVGPMTWKIKVLWLWLTSSFFFFFFNGNLVGHLVLTSVALEILFNELLVLYRDPISSSFCFWICSYGYYGEIFIQLHCYVRFFLLEILFLMLVLGYLRPFHRKIVN